MIRPHTGGAHLVQTPGPTNVPGRVLRRLAEPTPDHRSPAFQKLAASVLQRLPELFGTVDPVVVYPSSGTGMWEAALVNTLPPGARVLVLETGHFSTLWGEVATRLGFAVQTVSGDWRHGVDAAAAREALGSDVEREIAAVLVVHNETSTGARSDVDAVRRAMDNADHPALLLVDAVSSLGSADVAHDRWRADVTVSASQKGLMLPPGLGLAAIGPRAEEAAHHATLPRSYFDWRAMLGGRMSGSFPYTPSTNLIVALDEALTMLTEEGLPAVYARHDRLAHATRAAVTAWGLQIWCLDEAAYSPTVSAVRPPEGVDATTVIRVAYESLDLSLGLGLGRTAGQVFRIGHLGHLNELGLMATLAGVELALRRAGVAVAGGALDAALRVLDVSAVPDGCTA